ncbi:hypothetical protein JCM11251_003640 [Rhodosporidiobolus azoricus]
MRTSYSSGGGNGISLDHILLDREHAQQDLQRNQPNQDLHVKLVGFCSSTYDYGDEGHNPYEPADWQIASPEQMLNGNSYGAFGPPRAADVWAVGVVTSLLLFNKNHAFLDLINDDLFSAIDLTDAKEYFPLSHEAIRLLASLDRQAGWPEFFDLVNVLDRENHDPT